VNFTSMSVQKPSPSNAHAYRLYVFKELTLLSLRR
jgi:hypothetical protein